MNIWLDSGEVLIFDMPHIALMAENEAERAQLRELSAKLQAKGRFHKLGGNTLRIPFAKAEAP